MATPHDTNAANPKDATVKESGDNRRLGDVDGNQAAGDSKSPGADDPRDDSAAPSDSKKR